MGTRQDLESYLMASSYLCEELADSTWVVRDPSQPEDRIVVRLEDNLVVLRLNVLSLSAVQNRGALFEALLRLNASDMAHGAYALAGEQVVLVSAHRLDTLDEEELRSSVDDFILAVQNHHAVFKTHCEVGGTV